MFERQLLECLRNATKQYYEQTKPCCLFSCWNPPPLENGRIKKTARVLLANTFGKLEEKDLATGQLRILRENQPRICLLWAYTLLSFDDKPELQRIISREIYNNRTHFLGHIDVSSAEVSVVRTAVQNALLDNYRDRYPSDLLGVKDLPNLTNHIRQGLQDKVTLENPYPILQRLFFCSQLTPSEIRKSLRTRTSTAVESTSQSAQEQWRALRKSSVSLEMVHETGLQSLPGAPELKQSFPQ